MIEKADGKFCQNCRYYRLNLVLAATFCEKKKKYLEGEEALKNTCDEWEEEIKK